MAVNIKTMLFCNVTVYICLMDTSATDKPVYQSVQHHIAEYHSFEVFVSLYLVIPAW